MHLPSMRCVCWEFSEGRPVVFRLLLQYLLQKGSQSASQQNSLQYHVLERYRGALHSHNKGLQEGTSIRLTRRKTSSSIPFQRNSSYQSWESKYGVRAEDQRGVQNGSLFPDFDRRNADACRVSQPF